METEHLGILSETSTTFSLVTTLSGAVLGGGVSDADIGRPVGMPGGITRTKLSKST